LTSSLSDANHPASLLSGLHYNAYVAATQDALGNGVNETVGFDTRGRLTAISALKNATTVYSLKGPASGNTQIQYAADDNITGTIDSANGTWNYGFDPLNRISTAGALTFDIDRTANRWHQNPTGAQISFDPATNRIASGNGVTYDAAGNITNDGMHSFTYDAEGRIVSADAGSIASTYDAFGRRVRKVVSGSAKDYVYDTAGRAVVEVVAGVWQRAEIYVGGRHLGTYSGGGAGVTSFSHTDWLGTERVRTNASGVVSETCTSNPYGDALSCAGTDVSPVHYTGLERDTETNLDHAWFRYYNSRLGVWMTPDPAGIGAVSAGNPQSWNANAYVANSPLNGSDPLGLVGPWGDVAGSGRRSILRPGYLWSFTFWFDELGNAGLPTPNSEGLLPTGAGYSTYYSGGSSDTVPANNGKCGTTVLPRSVGLSYGGNVDAGAGYEGITATGSAGVGIFANGNTGVSTGAFAGGGGTAYFFNGNVGAPKQQGQPFNFGGYAGAGPSIWISNAGGAKQLGGPFTTLSLNAGAGPIKASLQLSYGGGIWQLSFGPPVPYVSPGTPSISVSKLTTKTTTTSGCD
jgi:RHS repeat-associated protein